MRVSGSFWLQFLAVRADKNFFDVCATPSLAAELTVQPIDRFPLDAAIVFSDILVRTPHIERSCSPSLALHSVDSTVQ
jgi:uroporphyrinogen decarboxylase